MGMTAASLLMAGTVSGAVKPDSMAGVPYRTLGRTGETVSANRLSSRWLDCRIQFERLAICLNRSVGLITGLAIPMTQSFHCACTRIG